MTENTNIKILKFVVENYYAHFDYHDPDYKKNNPTKPPIDHFYCENNYTYHFNIKLAMILNDLDNFDIPFFIID